MKISEILAGSKHTFPSIEIVPPLNGMSKTELLDKVRTFMEFSPKYINITCHRDEYAFRKESDGTYTRHLVRNRISEYPPTPIQNDSSLWASNRRMASTSSLA